MIDRALAAFLFQRALDPDTAYAIASLGMREGRFASDRAGKAMSLPRFISGSWCKYRHARQIINGMRSPAMR